MDCDLHRVIQSKQKLSDKHFKCFVKQMLEGIKVRLRPYTYSHIYIIY